MLHKYIPSACVLAGVLTAGLCHAGSSQIDALQEEIRQRVQTQSLPHPDTQIRTQVQETRRDIAEALKRSFAGDVFTAETTNTGDFTVKPSFVPKDWNLYYKGNTLKIEYRISF